MSHLEFFEDYRIILIFFSEDVYEPSIDSDVLLPLKDDQELGLAPGPPKEQLDGVMATIDFANSPYLDFDNLPSKIVPIMVLSKASNIEVRDAIRRTWGFYRLYRRNTLRVKVFFLVGTDDFMTQRIRMEQNVFDDVIQVTIPDMYSFSAYKELSAMLWVRRFLPDAGFFVKTEDDVILNMKLLIDEFLPQIESVVTQQLIVGWFGAEHTVQRGNYQKFINAVIPQSAGELHYAMSLLYGVTALGADRMIDSIRHVELIEYPGDPFVTGVLRDAARVQIKNLATVPNSLKYDLANGACKAAFEKSSSLLICTSSLHIGSIKSMTEYFDAWNFLIGEK